MPPLKVRPSLDTNYGHRNEMERSCKRGRLNLMLRPTRNGEIAAGTARFAFYEGALPSPNRVMSAFNADKWSRDAADSQQGRAIALSRCEMPRRDRVSSIPPRASGGSNRADSVRSR